MIREKSYSIMYFLRIFLSVLVEYVFIEEHTITHEVFQNDIQFLAIALGSPTKLMILS